MRTAVAADVQSTEAADGAVEETLTFTDTRIQDLQQGL